MKISFVTTCKGRLEHLKLTYAQNIRTAITEHDDLEFILINYDSPDALDNFVANDLDFFRKKGYLKYFKYDNLPIYSHSYAKNLSHSHATGDIIVNLDADNFIVKGFVLEIKKIFLESKVIAAWFHKFSPGSGGRIIVRKEVFYKVHGYNENLKGWGADDFDLKLRLKIFSIFFKKKIENIDIKYAHALSHSDTQRILFMKETSPFLNNYKNIFLSCIFNLKYIVSLIFRIKHKSYLISKFRGKQNWGWYLKYASLWERILKTEKKHSARDRCF